MEGHPRWVCGATQTLVLLAFIYLVYTQSFGFDPINLYSGTTRALSKSATLEEVGVLKDTNLQPLFQSLLGNADLQNQLQTTGFACDSTIHSLVCIASNPLKIDTKTMQIYTTKSTLLTSTNPTNILHYKQVRPYAWSQLSLLQNITPVNFLPEPPPPLHHHCTHTHPVPALVFSSGGFSGNLFHEFNEIIIPLYLTSRVFNSRVRFIVVDYNPYIVTKYNRVFSRLSAFEILNSTVDTAVHCFPGAVVGLQMHGFLAINSSGVPKGNSMTEFRKFIRTVYGLKTVNVSDIAGPATAPVLVLVSRRKTRSFLNEDEMVDMMEDLGFEVIVVRSVKKMSNLERFGRVLSTCSVLVGAHGAGMTNQVFLPAGAVVVQVVPLGLEWPASVYFGEPAVRMGLNYLEYKIGPGESSLSDTYSDDDPVISDPGSVFAKGYYFGKEMYLDKQNVRVDVNRFKGTLSEALRLLKRI
ncbi:hypothetical protein SSX86_006823 [Deinandra increscens subsp. villosa]|uniref:Glycosyltransferase 61 catalytic domain-containing protein n=1 Tax=Deinandra increscens subsp. villosa TaxID=3103831 RepID=A0AAP0DGU3_9ASTR